MSAIDDRLAALGIVLPSATPPLANYVPAVISGSLLVISGQLPMQDGKLLATGKLGGAVSIEDGRAAARCCLVNVLAQAKLALGNLSRIKRIVRLGGFIACTAEFTQHAQVMNGASDLAVEILGDAGRHARSTVGVPSLPLDAAVEVEAMIEIA